MPGTSRAGRGAAAPLRFVFVRRPRNPGARRVRSSVRKVATAARKTGPIRPVSAVPEDLLHEPTAISGIASTKSLWLPPLIPGVLDVPEIPPGLPPIPPMLLEGDASPDEAVTARSGETMAAREAEGGTVWLAGCDPRTLLLGWEEPCDIPGQPRSATEWRLRSRDEPEVVLATGSLPTDRRFLFVEDPPRAIAHVAEIGVWSARGDWECLAVSAAVSLPEAPASDPTSPTHSSQGQTGIRPGFPRAYFESILGNDSEFSIPQGSSGMGPAGRSRDVSADRGVFPPSSAAALGSGETLFPSSSAVGSAGLVAEAGGFHFRVNAEVVVFGSTEPGARVTLAGRPVVLRPDGSFTFRCALPDGRFELPLVAVSSEGHGHRAALLTLQRGTVVHGEVGVHPIDPGLPSPEAIP